MGTPHRPDELLRGPFLGTDALRRGLLTRAQLRGASWRRLFRDVYVDSGTPDSYLLRCRAAGLVLPPGAALTGRSAAHLDGVPLGATADPVEVLAPPACRFDRSGFHVKRTVWLPAWQIVRGHPLAPGAPPVTVPCRTAWEIASGRDLIEAVVGLDALFRRRRPRKALMAAWVARRPYARAARAIGLTDGTAESPQETRARVRIVLAGFPPPVGQYTIVTDAGFVARVDLAWPDAKVAVEYDGLWHVGDAGQMAYDRRRLGRLQRLGWEVQFLTARDLQDDARFAEFCARLRGALGI